MPIIWSQALLISNEQTNTILEKMAQLIFMMMIHFWNIFLFMFTHFTTSITTSNKTLPEYLYPVFKDNNFNRLNNQVGLNLNYKFGILSNITVHMKIDSFIARLNEEYVGFYCYNLFQLTKLAFLQYLYTFMTAYVLISGLIK